MIHGIRQLFGSMARFVLIILTVIGIDAQIVAADDCALPSLQPLRRAIQELVLKDPKLDGVRVDCVYDENDGKTLLVQGIMARSDQREAFEKLIEGEAQYLSTLNAAFESRGHWAIGPQWNIVNVDAFKKALQKRLVVFNSDSSLRGTRVDRIYFDGDGKPALAGVYWLPEGITDPSAEENLKRKIRSTTMKLIAELEPEWRAYARQGAELNLGPMKWNKVNPVRPARKLIVADPRLDGMRIDEVFFDGEGDLVFSGVSAKPEQWQWFHEIVVHQLRNSPWREWKRSPQDINLGIKRHLPEYRLPKQDIIDATSGFIREGNLAQPPIYDKVRIDRLYFNEDNQLTFAGIRWNEKDGTEQKTLDALRPFAELEKRIAADIKEKWPDSLAPNEFHAGEAVTMDRVAPAKSSSSVLSRLWDLTPRLPVLDGVRIDAAYYDGPMLHFVGLAARLDQSDLVRRALRDDDVALELLRDVAPNGFVIDRPRIVPLHSLLQHVRQRVAARNDLAGVWVDRCFYDQHRRLTFIVDTWDEEKRFSQISEVIESELSSNPQWLTALELNNKAQVVLGRVSENLLSVLREIVASRPDLDGVRLDRAFYDQNRTLFLGGLFGRPEQLTLLNQLVAATIGENEVRKRQFAEVCPADPAHFRLLPIDSFLQCIQELIPWFAELDGVTIHRAYHHADGKFTLVAVTDHESQKEALSSILGRELGSVEQGRLRLQENPLIRRADGEIKAVVMEAESQSIERDPFQAMAILSTGWQLYHKQRYHEATELLDGGLRFDPKSPYLWYLRSLCYLGLGKYEVAQRDVFRGARLDNRTFGSRHAFLARVQGPQRSHFERLRQGALLKQPNAIILCSCPSSSSGTPSRPCAPYLPTTPFWSPCEPCFRMTN